jgi:hypothetical protein
MKIHPDGMIEGTPTELAQYVVARAKPRVGRPLLQVRERVQGKVFRKKTRTARRPNQNTPWTQEDKILLVQLKGEGLTVGDLAKRFGRSRASIADAIFRFTH